MTLDSLAGRRLIFTAPPFAGHLYPMLPLARAAQRQGAHVHFITGPRKLPLLERLGFDASPFLPDNPDALESVANPSERIGSNPLRLVRQFRRSVELLVHEKPRMRQLFDRLDPDLVVADSVTGLPGVLCEELRIPWITTIASPLAIETQRGTPSYMGGWRPPRTALGRTRDWLGRRLTRGVKRSIFWAIRDERRRLGLPPDMYRADGTEVLYSPHSLLGFGLRELEFERDWPPAFEMIGPILETPETPNVPAIEWPTQRPRVLVTFGTHLLWLKRELVSKCGPMLRANPDVFFCIAMGEAANFSPEPIERGPNWSVYPYVPYDRELVNFDAVVHHAGAGVTYACIAARKPSLVIPQDFDQFDYARRIEAAGIGTSMATIDAPGIGARIPELLSSKWQPALDRMHEALASYRPEQRFLEEADRLIAAFGRPTRAPDETGSNPGSGARTNAS